MCPYHASLLSREGSEVTLEPCITGGVVSGKGAINDRFQNFSAFAGSIAHPYNVIFQKMCCSDGFLP